MALLLTVVAFALFVVPSVQKTLIWSDEFNGSSLDQKKWNIESGYLNVNNEQENYQAGNVQVQGGNLVITAKRQQVGGQRYTSGRINTSGKFSFKYGRAEARIKLPKVQGLWPAFWMLGESIGKIGWPKCGEIDIMEQVNTENKIFGTLHWFTSSPTFTGHAQYGLTTQVGNTADWHVYAVEFFLILNVAVGGDLPGQNINEGALPAKMLVDYVRVYKWDN